MTHQGSGSQSWRPQVAPEVEIVVFRKRLFHHLQADCYPDFQSPVNISCVLLQYHLKWPRNTTLPLPNYKHTNVNVFLI